MEMINSPSQRVKSMDDRNLKSPLQVSSALRELPASVQDSNSYVIVHKSSSFNRISEITEDDGTKLIQSVENEQRETKLEEAEELERCPIVDPGGQENLKGDSPNTGLPVCLKDIVQERRHSGGCSKRRKRRRRKQSVKKGSVSPPLCPPCKVSGLQTGVLVRRLAFFSFLAVAVCALCKAESAPAHGVKEFQQYRFIDNSVNLSDQTLYIIREHQEVCRVQADGSHEPKKCKESGITLYQINTSCFLMETMDTEVVRHFLEHKEGSIYSEPIDYFNCDGRSGPGKMNDTAPRNQTAPRDPLGLCNQTVLQDYPSPWKKHTHMGIIFSMVIPVLIVCFIYLRRRCRPVTSAERNGSRSVEGPVLLPAPEEVIPVQDEYQIQTRPESETEAQNTLCRVYRGEPPVMCRLSEITTRSL